MGERRRPKRPLACRMPPPARRRSNAGTGARHTLTTAPWSHRLAPAKLAAPWCPPLAGPLARQRAALRPTSRTWTADLPSSGRQVARHATARHFDDRQPLPPLPARRHSPPATLRPPCAARHALDARDADRRPPHAAAAPLPPSVDPRHPPRFARRPPPISAPTPRTCRPRTRARARTCTRRAREADDPDDAQDCGAGGSANAPYDDSGKAPALAGGSIGRPRLASPALARARAPQAAEAPVVVVVFGVFEVA